MNSTNNSSMENSQQNTINLKTEIQKYAIHWKWFLLSIILSIGLAFLYLRYATPSYLASTKIMIKDNKKSGISKELEAFKDLGIVGGGSVNNPDNEIEVLKSRKILKKVVHELGLNVSYFVKGKIKQTEVYKNAPIQIIFTNNAIINESFAKLTITLNYEKNNISLIKNDNSDSEITTSFNTNIKLNNIPEFKILKRQNNTTKQNAKTFYCYIEPENVVIDKLKKFIRISAANRNSSILNLSLESNILSKAEATLNKLVEIYNDDAIKDKNKVSQRTNDFITQRLKNVSTELALVDDNIKNFKRKNKVTDIKSESKLFLQKEAINRQKLIEATTQLSLLKSIEKELQNTSENFLPSNLGIADGSISQGIIRYNDLISNKNRLKESAGSKNLVLINVENNIQNQRKSLIASLKNQKQSLEITVQSLSKEANVFNSKISSIPTKERQFLDIARQQEIIAGLYSYLLKKKEETEISLAINKIPNARVIEKAYGSKFPTKPKRKLIFLVALFLGTLIPFIIIYIKSLLDTKIHSRKDIEELTSIPYLGDVPHSEENEKIVIKQGARTSAAEAFRIIRTNLDFLTANLKHEHKGKIIFITSTISGEGKSFTSINLAATLSLSGKKTVLVGMDLRAPKITQYLNIPDRKGITNLLTNNNINIDDLKFTIPEIKDLDLISSGVIPPNPAELLMSDKIASIFEELSNKYDYVLIDTAPVGLVTDTLLISKFADLVIYVTRAGYLDKKMLEIPQALYNEKKLPNTAIVLNDTDINKGYGYGYGYGYSYVDENKTSWLKKIFKK